MSIIRRSLIAGLATLGALAGTVAAAAPALAAEGFGVTGTFGSATSTPSNPQPLSNPSGVAVNETTGDVYVLDRGNRRVEYFTATGTYLGQFNGNENPSFPNGFDSTSGIAVDNAPGASHGDVYVSDPLGTVVDKFSETGIFLSQVTDFLDHHVNYCEIPNFEYCYRGGLLAVAVDSSGNLWTIEAAGGYGVNGNTGEGGQYGGVAEFSEAGTLLKEFSVTGPESRSTEDQEYAPGVLAVDPLGGFYVSRSTGLHGTPKEFGPGGLEAVDNFAFAWLEKFNAEGNNQTIGETQTITPVSGVAIELGTNDLYINQGTSIAQYGPFGEPLAEPLLRSGAKAMISSKGIAIDAKTHQVYVAEAAKNEVDILTTGPAPPAPKTDASSEVKSNSALVSGDLNPEGAARGIGFYFQYNAGESCGGPGSNTTPLDNGNGNLTGSSDLDAAAVVKGLQPMTEYTYCFVAESFGSKEGAPLKFTTGPSSGLYKPTVASESAVNITPFDAALEAKLITDNEATEYQFEYANNEALVGATVIGAGTLSGSLQEQAAPPLEERVEFCKGASPPEICKTQVPAPVDLGGTLEPDTTYYYRAVATDSTGTTYGLVSHFTTSPLRKPEVGGESSSSIGQSTATLASTVDPLYQEISRCEFQYVTEEELKTGGFTEGSPSMPCAQSTSELGHSGAAVSVGASLTGLQPNTMYYYRLVATNGTGTSEGEPGQFRTLPSDPVVVTGEASGLSVHGATLSGSVNPGGEGPNSNTTYYFQYGKTTAYGNQIPLAAGQVGEGDTPVNETAVLSELEPGTTYHYRLVAVNDSANHAGGEPQLSYGLPKTFTTVVTPPMLGPVEVGAITQTSATVITTLDPRGLLTRYELQLGNVQGSLEYQASGNTEGSETEPLALHVASLLPGTVYHYKLVVAGEDGTVESPEGTFTTLMATPEPITLGFTQPVIALPNVVFPSEESGTTTGPPKPKGSTNAQKLAKALQACKRKPKKKRARCEKQARQKYPNTR